MSLVKPIPSLKQLRHLVALAEFEHFGKAADSCLITQASLSASIKELENILGKTLVERTKRSVKMTPLAEQVVARARQVIIDVEDIVDLVGSDAEPLTGALRLGVIPTIAPFLLPRVLPTIRKAHPALKLFLREAQTAATLAELRAGNIDLALIAYPFPTKDLETLVFADDPLWFAYHSSYEIGDQEQVSVKKVATDELLLLEEGHCLRDHVLTATNLIKTANDNAFQATSLSTLVQMVENGLGSTILPKMAIDGGITRGTKIGLRPLYGKETSRQIGFAWRKSSARKTEFRMLAELFQSELGTPILPKARARK